MTLGRTNAGINKAGGRHEERASQVHRYVAAGLAGGLARGAGPISWLDLSADLVRPKFGNIRFDATRARHF